MKYALSFAMIFFLYSCSSDASMDIIIGSQNNVLSDQAIKIGDDLYYIPIGVDQDGCMTYQLYSESMMVSQVITYRNKDGIFTTSKNSKNCM